MGQEKRLILENVNFKYSSRNTFFRRAHHQVLYDVSFSLYAGETLGVIGGNGSGKSSLLKVLSGIYQCDSGEIIRNYKKASLLALGIGFDIELTGRENILLSGILLGARRSEVESKLGEIIEFSELDEAMDEPLKTYSSGMRARLGFSIAISLESDLMLIDEVLSVGDNAFRLKAMAAMKERVLSHQSAVFVSHSLRQVEQLCDRTVWLEGGRVRAVDTTSSVISAYRAQQKELASTKS